MFRFPIMKPSLRFANVKCKQGITGYRFLAKVQVVPHFPKVPQFQA